MIGVASGPPEYCSRKDTINLIRSCMLMDTINRKIVYY